MIYKLKCFSCKTYAIFFHLWSGGGPNWRRDYDLWPSEQEAKWTLVGSKSKESFADVARSKPSYADAVRSKPVLNKPVFCA